MEISKIKPTIKGYFISHYISIVLVVVIIIAIGALIYAKLLPIDGFIGLIILALGLVLVIFALIHCKLHSDATSIYFDEDKMVYETGIFSHKKKKIPVNMITDSSVTRRFIERIFNVATMNISTSGRSGYEIICDGLDFKETEEIHAKLYELIKKQKNNREMKL